MNGLIYARISQVFGETDDSLDNQVGQATTAAQTLCVPISHIFRERDSGHETADTRLELLKARELVRTKQVTHFFIHNFDRLSRTPEELVGLWKEAQANGVKVVVAMWPQFHSVDLDMAKMMLRMIGMVGEFEWSFIRARTTQNKKRIRDKGQVVGEGGPRFGFTWNRETRARCPSEAKHPQFGISSAEIVRAIFDLIGNHGYSLRRCARELNLRCWPTPSVFRGKKYKDGRSPKWTNDSVRLILIDEQYKGVVTCSRTQMVGKRKTKKKPREEWQVLSDARTEPLVSDELWDRANQSIRDGDVIGQRVRAAEARNESNFALYRGLIYCGQCNKPLRPVWSKAWSRANKDYSAPKVRLYRCDSRKDNFERGIDIACRGRSIYEQKVKSAVWEQVVKVAMDEGLVLAEAERLKLSRPGEAVHRDGHKAALHEIESADRRLKNLVASLAETDNAEDRAMIREAIEAARTGKEGHQRRAARLAEQLSAYDRLDRMADQMIERCRQLCASSPELLDMPDEQQRHWLEWLGVTITGNGLEITIRFNMGLTEVAESSSQPTRATTRS